MQDEPEVLVAAARVVANLLAIVALCGMAASARAAEWSVDANAGTRGEYVDNPRLIEDSPGAAAGFVTDLAATFARATESGKVQLQPRLSVREYSGDYSLSGVDGGLNFDWSATGERTRGSLSAGYYADNTTSAGFGTTGYTETDIPRETWTAAAEGAFQPSDRQLLLARFDHQRVDFERGERAGLVDYDYSRLLGYAQRSLGPRTRVRLLGTAGLLRVPETGVSSQDYALGLGLDRDLTERWTVSLDAGPSITYSDGEASDVGASYRFNLHGAWTRTDLQLSAEQRATPVGGRGVLEDRFESGLAVTHRLTERWALEAGAAYAQFDRDRQPGAPAERRSYASARASAQWLATDQWVWRLTATHEQQDTDVTAAGNRLMLGFEWRGRMLGLSR
jgi:hypothetical protein